MASHATVRLSDYCASISDGDHQAPPKTNSGVPFITISAIKEGSLRLAEASRFVPISYYQGLSPVRRAQAGDVLYSVTGSIGIPALVGNGEPFVFQRHIALLRPMPGRCDPRWLAYMLASPSMFEQARAIATGTAQLTVPLKGLRELRLPAVSFAQQHRIVAKLDALTVRLTRARAELDRAPVLAENLRQAAVTAAFRGDLTATWRRTNPEQLPLSAADADRAFERVAGVKRKKEAAAIGWRPDLALPMNWRWAAVDEVVGIVQYGTSAKTSDDSDGVPVLRMGNIQRGGLDWASLKYLPSNHGEFPKLLLSNGDVLFNRTNSIELVGKSAVFRGSARPVSFASYLIRVRCSAILPDLLARYLNSPFCRAWVNQTATQQVGQANVNGTKLKALGMPLPPAAEQEEMVRLLDAVFARAERLEAEASRARRLIDRLEAAILARAFRGELVPQDPNDEPASAPLDRIRAQRAAAPMPRRGTRSQAVNHA